MLSDPISVTVDGSAKSLPKVSAAKPVTPRTIQSNHYRTADQAYSVTTSQLEARDGSKRAEVILRKRVLDIDVGTTYEGFYSSGVGLILESAPYGLTTPAQIAELRTAILAFVDTTLTSRLLGGEA